MKMENIKLVRDNNWYQLVPMLQPKVYHFKNRSNTKFVVFRKTLLKIKRINFYLSVNWKKYSIYNFDSEIEKNLKRTF